MIPLLDPHDAQRPTAIALGSFDGLHQGHRRVIAAITAAAPGPGGVAGAEGQPEARPETSASGGAGASSGASGAAEGAVPQASGGVVPTLSADAVPTVSESVVPTVSESVVPTVVSFWPHPRELLHGETRLRLDLPSEKLELLEPLGIRQLVLVRFDAALAALSPEAFVEQVLVGQLQARHVAVGDNFRFGAGRSGDVGDLARLGARHGLAVTVVPMLHVDGERISSSRIRRALAAGEIGAARDLLQRPYRFSGAVERGRGLGRGLGWPTANLRVDGRKFLPLEGVYAAWAWCHRPAGPEPTAAAAGGSPPQGPLAPVRSSDGRAESSELMALPAVMNLGPQPTVDPTAPSAVEVHLLDRDLNLNGAWLTVEPVQLLRRQCRFPSLEALSAQISADAAMARGLLARCGPAAAAPLGAQPWTERSALL